MKSALRIWAAAGFVPMLLGWPNPSLAELSGPVPYCQELKELNNYAMSQRRFAPIIEQPKEGNYRATSLTLTGWVNCGFYGTTTYTCDSTELKSMTRLQERSNGSHKKFSTASRVHGLGRQIRWAPTSWCFTRSLDPPQSHSISMKRMEEAISCD